MKPSKRTKRLTRHRRIRAKIKGTEAIPRIVIFRSNQHTYAQGIDDKSNKTLFTVSDLDAKKSKQKAKKVDRAVAIGNKAGELLLARGIKAAVFDRGGYRYHGRVKAVAEGLRQAGIHV